MNIAITTNEASLESDVFSEFAKAPFLLIVNVEAGTVLSYEHSRSSGSDQELARIILQHQCEAVITGTLEKEAFDILADEGVTRFRAIGTNAQSALAAMENKSLELIRNHDGSATCGGNHHH